MNKLLRSPIAARIQGVLPPGARQFAKQTAKQLASELPRAVNARARPFVTGRARFGARHTVFSATSGSLLCRTARPDLATLLHE